ncbi:hypothetical protein [Planctomicrobium piriforme]|uniref:hypothetical protein n=1 Tax=Planctomicrobium piriforme TaxID=1576369 RepID=UPI00111369E8|nr:hypothetical protein [Planctomicrobium piriforme]
MEGKTGDALLSKHKVAKLLADDATGLQLTAAQQEEYLQFLACGLPPAEACKKVGISLAAIAAVMETDERFRNLVDRVRELLSQNVAAALYCAAMKGNVSAQTFYLKNRPPPDWFETADADALTPEELTDDELLAQFQKLAAELLPQPAPGDSQSRCETKS